jgi:hypothetical protein
MIGPTGTDVVTGSTAYSLSLMVDKFVPIDRILLPTLATTLPTKQRLLETPIGDGTIFTSQHMTLAALLLATMTIPTWSIIDLASPLSEITPIHIGCVPTSVDVTLEDLVYSAATLGSSADIVLFPETALVLPEDEQARQRVMDEFTWQVTRQYGNRVVVGLESGLEGQRKNEVVLIDKLGEMASYEKQRLVPCTSFLRTPVVS